MWKEPGQADALVGKLLRPSRARRLLLAQHGAESELSVLALAAGKDLRPPSSVTATVKLRLHAAIAIALTLGDALDFGELDSQ
jgi:hypothetical protein